MDLGLYLDYLLCLMKYFDYCCCNVGLFSILILIRLQPPSGQQLQYDVHRISGRKQCLCHLLACYWNISLCQSLWHKSLDAWNWCVHIGLIKWLRIDSPILLSNGSTVLAASPVFAIADGQSKREGLVRFIYFN